MWPNGVVIRHQLYRINGSMKSYIAHNDKECINWKIMFIFRRRIKYRLSSQRRLLILNFKIFLYDCFFFLFFDCWIWIAINFVSKSALVFIAVWLKKQHFFFTEENLKNYSGIHIVKIHDNVPFLCKDITWFFKKLFSGELSISTNLACKVLQ